MPYKRTLYQRIRTFVWLVIHPNGTDNIRGPFKMKMRMPVVPFVVSAWRDSNILGT